MTSSNLVLLLLGLHGSGKSTFASAATGGKDIPLGRGVGPCTRDCATYSFNHRIALKGSPPREFLFTIIDTPGLADKNTEDENLEVLQGIADQLRQLKHDRVSGVIYCHSIEGVRLHGVDMANLRLLKAICGVGFFPRIAFVTTRWDRMKDSEYQTLLERNRQLEEVRKGMFPGGPQIFKFLNDGKSHQPVLEYFARQGSVTGEPILQFAQETAKYRQSRLKRGVKQTTAGKQVSKPKVRKSGMCTFL